MKLTNNINVRVPAPVYAEVEKEAERSNVTLSHFVREAIRRAMAGELAQIKPTLGAARPEGRV